MEIANILKQQQVFQQQILYLSARPVSESRLLALRCNLQQASQSIESLCRTARATPADLKTPSRRAYAWMKFLAVPPYLAEHLRAVRHLRQEIEAVAPQGRVYVELTNMRGLYRGRIHPHAISLKLHEGFLAASDELLTAAIARITGRENTAVALRQFATSSSYVAIVRKLDCYASGETDNASGGHHNLQTLFLQVNQQYFHGKLSEPRLSWGARRTHRKLGHYERARDRIVVSPILDDPRVPSLAIEFVLYHELLHRQIGCRWQGGKARVHTPEFRRREREFHGYQQAQEWLSWIASHI